MTSMLIEPKTRITVRLLRHSRASGNPGQATERPLWTPAFAGVTSWIAWPRPYRGPDMLDAKKLASFVDQCWGDAIVPTLVDYIRIPNKSPSFDPEWAAHGHMEEAVSLFERWARTEIAALSGATLEIVRLPGRTPLMLIEVPGEGADTVLLYGHLDKQ